jgi:hypothetical protein
MISLTNVSTSAISGRSNYCPLIGGFVLVVDQLKTHSNFWAKRDHKCLDEHFQPPKLKKGWFLLNVGNKPDGISSHKGGTL